MYSLANAQSCEKCRPESNYHCTSFICTAFVKCDNQICNVELPSSGPEQLYTQFTKCILSLCRILTLGVVSLSVMKLV